jgi:hypothetical protein
MPRLKNRKSYRVLLERTLDMLLLVESGRRPTRLELAGRWRVSDRSVSHVVAEARANFGVTVKACGTSRGYELVSVGIFNLEAVRRLR